MAVTRCPTKDEITGFAGGGLSAERVEEIGNHFDRCKKCLNILSSIDSEAIDSDLSPLANLIRKAVDKSLDPNDHGPDGYSTLQLRSETLGPHKPGTARRRATKFSAGGSDI